MQTKTPRNTKKAPRPKKENLSGFLRLNLSYSRVVKRQEVMSYAERLQDWIHVKQSSNGSNLRKRKVTLVSPVTGVLVHI